MKHFPIFLIIFWCFQTNAQLVVKPSAEAASFIYVKDRFLFVENKIHLEKNQQQEKAASIYLRKGSQLLQGNKPQNLNSGNGQISIFQEGSANAFNYNYWSMPVSDNFQNGNQFTNRIFEALDKTHSRRATLTPSLEGSANPLQISRRWIYKFSGADYDDWQYVGNNFNLQPGEGFSMKGMNGINTIEIEGVENNPGNAQRYDFRGKPNDGEIKLTVQKDKVRLIGNPYPSALNLRQFLIDNTGTTGIAYFWDFQDNTNSHYLKDYEGGYGTYSPGANAYAPAVFKTYNGAGGETGNSGSSGNDYAREFSPVAQGFMVIGKTNGDVVFNNSYRNFVKENPQTSEFRQTENPKIFRINFTFNKTYTRQLLLAFDEKSTIYEDHAMDARSFGALLTDAAWLIQEKTFLINILPFDIDTKIPLLISSENESEVEITLAETIPEIQDIFLFDRETETYHDLLQKPVKLNLSKGNFNDRFFIAFSQPEQEKEIPIAEEITDNEEGFPPEIEIIHNKKRRQIEILAPNRLEDIKVFDLAGSLIFQKKVYENKQYYYFYTGNLPDAVYIIKVKTIKEEVSKKLLLTK